MKIAWVLALAAMLVLLWPRARHMLKNSPKAGEADWAAVLVPLAMVAGLVVLLIFAV